MVESETAGVLFTANPLTGKRTETVVDATLGLGEALVSGQVEPDHYVVNPADGRILSKTLGAKAVAILGKPDGGTVTRTEDAASRQALPDGAIIELSTLGQRVARLFGVPQDIEWAWAGEKLFLLQSRPIASLFPVPDGMAPEPLQVLFSFGAVQGMLDPMTPLGRAVPLATGQADVSVHPCQDSQKLGRQLRRRPPHPATPAPDPLNKYPVENHVVKVTTLFESSVQVSVEGTPFFCEDNCCDRSFGWVDSAHEVAAKAPEGAHLGKTG
jgi:hypothetical protein